MAALKVQEAAQHFGYVGGGGVGQAEKPVEVRVVAGVEAGNSVVQFQDPPDEVRYLRARDGHLRDDHLWPSGSP